MKILLVSPLPPPSGGIATWTVRYKQYCKEHQIPISIVNNALVGARREKRSSKLSIADELYRSISVIASLIRQIRQTKPDIIHLNSSCSRFGIYRDCLCAFIGKLYSIPVVVQCHCNIEDQLRGVLAVTAFKHMVSMCSKVLVLNRFSAVYAKKYAGESVMVIPNFAEKTALYDRKGVSETIQHAVFVGHVRKEKGAVEIIRVAEKLPDIQFTLIGPVQQEIAEMKRSSNVELTGPKSHEEVIELLKKADVFLFPSYTEGFANALLEAMASGLPIIATDVGANAEMLEGKGGIIIPIGDEKALFDAIIRLNTDASTRTRMSAWNVEKVMKNYLIDSVAKEIFEIYKMGIRC